MQLQPILETCCMQSLLAGTATAMHTSYVQEVLLAFGGDEGSSDALK